MSSSLAQQLQGIASLDAARLTSRTGAPTSKSYLFPPAEASRQHLDDVYQIALQGFTELLQVDPDIADFEDELFSESAKRVDRMVLSKEENRRLDVILGRCLRRLGKWLGVMAGGRCIEWLVRRFRVHEMNAETVLQVFLPYHESQNFPRMLSILTIPPTSPYFAPFAPLIKNAQPLPRSYVATAISPAKEPSLRLLSHVVGSVQVALEERVIHRALLSFWSSTIIEILEKGRNGKGLSEGLVKTLVGAFVEILSVSQGGADINAAVYPPLILLSRTVRLADGPFQALACSLITPNSGANPAQRILTLLVILNDRQDWHGGLGERAGENLAEIKLLGQTVQAAMQTYGFESGVQVLLAVMLQRPDLNSKHLAILLDAPNLSQSLVTTAAENILAHSSPSIAPEIKSAIQPLLTSLRERYPAIVDAAVIAANAQSILDETLVAQLSDTQGFAEVYAADVASRVQGIERMFSILNGSSQADKESALQALQSRLVDQDLPVIKAIYAHSKALHQTLGKRWIEMIRPAFTSSTRSSAVVCLHLQYINDYLLKSHHQEGQDVFEQLIFPCLLSVKGCAGFGAPEWKILANGELSQLSPVSVLLPHSVATNAGVRDAAIISSLARWASLQQNFERFSTFLLSQILSPDWNFSALAQLVLASLLRTVAEGDQTTLALRVIEAIQPMLRNASTNLVQSVDEVSVTNLVEALEVGSAPDLTEARVLASIIVALGAVTKPNGVTISMIDSSDADISATYKQFALRLYGLINSSTLHPKLSRHLLQLLFVQLGEDALTFFASVWTLAVSPPPLRVAALRHALAFVSAFATGSASSKDFQIILPALLVGMQDEVKEVRAAAVALLTAMPSGDRLTSSPDMYSLDTFYRDRSHKVQLLKPALLERYRAALLAGSSEIIIDSKHLTAVHTDFLSRQRQEPKKEATVRRSIIASVFSHIDAWQSVDIRSTLVQSMTGVRDSSVLKGIFALLSPILDRSTDLSAWISSLSQVEREAYLSLLFSAITAEGASVFNDTEGESWRFVISLFAPQAKSQLHRYLRKLILDRMLDSVFNSLPTAQQVSFTTALLHLLPVLPTDDHLAGKASLAKLQLASLALAQLLRDLAAPLETVIGKKRQKQEESVGSDPLETTLTALSLLIESRDWAKIGGDIPLLAVLMNILSSLLAKRHAVAEGLEYLEQEVLAAILTILEKVQDSVEVQKAQIGIEVIIKTIRSTSNPRTAQTALLVATELARLIPDVVLHHIMPIFTFMGAADYQRDDAYSFSVIERTVQGIIPVLVRSLTSSAGSGKDLWNASSSFLSIFTDLAGRLPKHRTQPFFSFFVEALGPAEYLTPVSLLLIGRTTVKGGRSGLATLQAIELALAIASSSTSTTRLQVVRDCIDEVGNLVSESTSAESTAFLTLALGEENSADRAAKQCTAIINFATSLATQLVGKPADQDVVQVTVQRLVELSATARSPALEQTDLQHNIQRCLGETIKLLGAENFLIVTRTLLDSQDEDSILRSLELFAERLPLVKKEIRVKAVSTVAAILRRSVDLLQGSSVIIRAALNSFRAVTTSALPGEDNALASVLPKMIDGLQSGKDAATSNEILALLEIATRHLGPRTIPVIQPMFTTLLTLCTRPTTPTTTFKAAFTTISAVIETLPTFISAKQLTTILRAAIDSRARNEETSSAVISTCAKKIPTKVLFPVVVELWKDAQNSAEQGFFYLLRLTLRNADRTVLPGLVKTIFAFFLNVFDLRHRLQQKAIDSKVINRVEESAIGSFLELVTKLNEATFKPLFTRLYDWAVVELAEGKHLGDARLVERKTVLLHVMMGLLTKFKHLLSPYIGTLLPHIEELLSAYAASELDNNELWTLLIRVLGKSFEVDDGAYWTEAAYQKLIPLLAAQISVFPDQTHKPTSVLSSTLAYMAGSSTSEPVLKSLNIALCLTTRDESVKVRLAALRCMDAVWERQAEEMVGLVPETVSEYLAELIEDENMDVARMARGVLEKIEKITGSLKEYLE